MAANPIPNGIPELLTMAEDCAEGVQELGATIGIAQNTAPKILADIADFRAKQQAYKNAQQAQESLFIIQRDNDKAARIYLVAARRRLVGFLGEDYSPAWGAAGFGPDSTAVPASIAGRQQLLQTLSQYFVGMAGQQDAGLGITAVRAGELYDDLRESRSAVAAGETALDDAKNARDAAKKALEKRVRGLISELEQLLAPDADEWATFNLNAPADPETPEEAEAPFVSPQGSGQIEVRIVLSRRADYNHIFLQRTGVDAEPHRVGDQFFPPNALLSDLPSGETRVFVCGVNEAGSGPLSPPALVTVG